MGTANDYNHILKITQTITTNETHIHGGFRYNYIFYGM